MSNKEIQELANSINIDKKIIEAVYIIYNDKNYKNKSIRHKFLLNFSKNQQSMIIHILNYIDNKCDKKYENLDILKEKLHP